MNAVKNILNNILKAITSKPITPSSSPVQIRVKLDKGKVEDVNVTASIKFDM